MSPNLCHTTSVNGKCRRAVTLYTRSTDQPSVNILQPLILSSNIQYLRVPCDATVKTLWAPAEHFPQVKLLPSGVAKGGHGCLSPRRSWKLAFVSSFWGLSPQTPTGAMPLVPAGGLPSPRPRPQTPTGAMPLDPAGGLPSPRPPLLPPVANSRLRSCSSPSTVAFLNSFRCISLAFLLSILSSHLFTVALSPSVSQVRQVLWTRKAPACLLTLLYAYDKPRLCINIHHYAPPLIVLQLAASVDAALHALRRQYTSEVSK